MFLQMSNEFSDRLCDDVVSSILHRDSWGAKGNNEVSKDMGLVKPNKGENTVDVAMQTAETDINSNAAYEDAIHVLSTKPLEEERWMQHLHREIITATSGQCVGPHPHSCRDLFVFHIGV